MSLLQHVTTSLVGLTSGIAVAFWIRHFARPKGILHLKSKLDRNLKTHDDGKSYVLLLIVDDSLKMGTGKIIAQCGHAIVGMYEDYFKEHYHAIARWYSTDQRIILKKKGDLSFTELQSVVRAWPRPVGTHVICDAGHTQVPRGSYTVMAVGPTEVEDVPPLLDSLPDYY